MGQQSGGSMKVVGRIFGCNAFEVWQCGREIAQSYAGDTAAVERVQRVCAGRNCLVVSSPRSRELSFLKIQVGKFLVISRGRIVQDGRFQFADTFAAGEDLKGLAQQTGVGNGLKGDVDQSPEPPS